MKTDGHSFQLAGAALAVGTFVVDVLTPPGVEVWVFYLPVVLSPVLIDDARRVAAWSVICSALVVFCVFVSYPSTSPVWWDILNRGFGVVAIGLTAAAGVTLCRRSARLQSSLVELQRVLDAHAETELALARNEERLRLAMQGGGFGTRDLDLRTGREVWSDTQFRILGYDPVSGGDATTDMWLTRTHPDDRRRVLRAKDQALREHSLYHLEYRICRPGQKPVAWVEMFGRYYYDGAGHATRFVSVSFDISVRKNLEQELLEVTTEQQQEIGHELHDGIGQELTGLGLIAQSLAHRLSENSPERAVAARLVAGLDQAHREVREVSRGIMPVHLDQNGLSAALVELAAKVTQDAGVPVICECPASLDLPDNATATQLFRIAQEAVSNAVRHGRPRQVRITLRTDPSELRLRVSDNGIGVASPADRVTGLGLRIMKYRSELIGGDLQIGPGVDGGTVVTVTLPWSNRNGEETGG